MPELRFNIFGGHQSYYIQYILHIHKIYIFLMTLNNEKNVNNCKNNECKM